MKILSMLLLAAICITSCKKEIPGNSPAEKKIVVKGMVRTTSGQPLAGARIYLRHQSFSDKSVTVTSDSRGEYVAHLEETAEANWVMQAQFSTSFNGRSYDFTIAPENMIPVGSAGGTRNFVWTLQGTIPGDREEKKIGGYVNFKEKSMEPVASDEVEFTLVPVSRLVDGSTGKRIIGFGKNNAIAIPGMYSNSCLADVPVGTYEISARRVKAGGAVEEMELREFGTADYTATVRANFFQTMPYRFQQIALDVRLK